MSRISALAEKRAAVQVEIDALSTSIETEARAFSADEQTKFDEHISEARALDAEISRIEEAEASRAAADAVSARYGLTGYAQVKEPAVYRSGGSNSYFRDLALATTRNDRDAADRLFRNDKMTAEVRAINTTDTSGGDFAPPLYMVEEYIALARAGRVVANEVTSQPLPMGTDSIVLPAIRGGSTVATQATQGASISNTDIVTASVTGPVVTLAGGQTVSLQLLEMSPVNMDAVLLQDLAADYASKLDQAVLYGTGSSGQMTGILTITNINAITYTTSAPTSALLYSKIADAVQQVHTGRFLPPTHIFMHPRRWASLLASVDGQNRPLIVPVAGGRFNTLGNLDAVQAEGYVGELQGLPVFVDANIPTNIGVATNQDKIIVARAADAYLYEGTPRAEVLPQTYGANLQVLVRMYNYAAFIGNRQPTAISVIAGTGLVAPTF